MSDFRSLSEGEPRPPTWAERERAEQLAATGVADVYVTLDRAPPEFWRPIVLATEWRIANSEASVWKEWEREIQFAFGWEKLRLSGLQAYESIVATGQRPVAPRGTKPVNVGVRLSAIEHILDVVGSNPEFADAVNERARHFRVGLRLEDTRFIPMTSEHLHVEVVQPTLLLLSDPALTAVDDLYRKAFDRVFSGDTAGAITASTTAVEEMLRIGLRETGSTLKPLVRKARETGWIIPAVEQMIVKLGALRDESDAHTAGTDSPEVAMYAMHTAAGILRYLAETRPSLA